MTSIVAKQVVDNKKHSLYRFSIFKILNGTRSKGDEGIEAAGYLTEHFVILVPRNSEKGRLHIIQKTSVDGMCGYEFVISSVGWLECVRTCAAGAAQWFHPSKSPWPDKFIIWYHSRIEILWCVQTAKQMKSIESSCPSRRYFERNLDIGCCFSVFYHSLAATGITYSSQAVSGIFFPALGFLKQPVFFLSHTYKENSNYRKLGLIIIIMTILRRSHLSLVWVLNKPCSDVGTYMLNTDN